MKDMKLEKISNDPSENITSWLFECYLFQPAEEGALSMMDSLLRAPKPCEFIKSIVNTDLVKEKIIKHFK